MATIYDEKKRRIQPPDKPIAQSIGEKVGQAGQQVENIGRFARENATIAANNLNNLPGGIAAPVANTAARLGAEFMTGATGKPYIPNRYEGKPLFGGGDVPTAKSRPQDIGSNNIGRTNIGGNNIGGTNIADYANAQAVQLQPGFLGEQPVERKPRKEITTLAKGGQSSPLKQMERVDQDVVQGKQNIPDYMQSDLEIANRQADQEAAQLKLYKSRDSGGQPIITRDQLQQRIDDLANVKNYPSQENAINTGSYYDGKHQYLMRKYEEAGLDREDELAKKNNVLSRNEIMDKYPTPYSTDAYPPSIRSDKARAIFEKKVMADYPKSIEHEIMTEMGDQSQAANNPGDISTWTPLEFQHIKPGINSINDRPDYTFSYKDGTYGNQVANAAEDNYRATLKSAMGKKIGDTLTIADARALGLDTSKLAEQDLQNRGGIEKQRLQNQSSREVAQIEEEGENNRTQAARDLAKIDLEIKLALANGTPEEQADALAKRKRLNAAQPTQKQKHIPVMGKDSLQNPVYIGAFNEGTGEYRKYGQFPPITPAAIAETAKMHKMTVEEAKRQLGL